ncbi:MAG: Maf family nucleotide pyrophosphatase [Burkholderiaceae bacterium]|nr:Maf family nucleotide pyrophosphatase [Burkholderiaceae bacterium]
MPFTFIYLASQSPRRAQLLQQIGVPFRALTPQSGEEGRALEALEAERPGEPPVRYVRRVTLLKLAAAAQRIRDQGLPPAPLLCADTTVALGAQILGKPRDARHAAAMLRALSGRDHRVLTAVAVQGAQGVKGEQGATHVTLSASRVRFAVLSRVDVAAYIDSGEWQGKAGGYAVQGRAAAFIAHISGSYSGIMGLPLHETALLLRRVGVDTAKMTT